LGVVVAVITVILVAVLVLMERRAAAVEGWLIKIAIL